MDLFYGLMLNPNGIARTWGIWVGGVPHADVVAIARRFRRKVDTGRACNSQVVNGVVVRLHWAKQNSWVSGPHVDVDGGSTQAGIM